MAKTTNNKKYSDAEMCCGTALMKQFDKLNTFRLESQKQDLINFLKSELTEGKVPQDYAKQIIENVSAKGVKYGIIYLGDIVLAGMGLKTIKLG